MSDRTFRIRSPQMRGEDVKAWEKELVELFKGIGIDAPIVANGAYGDIDRSYTKSFAYAVGYDAVDVLDGGISPADRTRLRNWRTRQTDAEKQRMEERKDWRRRLRIRYRKLREQDQGEVSTMVQKLLQDTWGWVPGVHDGIDLITLPDVPVFAPVRCKVFDVRSGGWWGKGAPSPEIAAKGDGIVQVEVLDTVGPFKKGHHLGFGHMEKAVVKVGDIVSDGRMLGRSGLANAWHIHWMLNDGSTTKGIGTRDPRECLEYTKKHG